MKNYIRTPTSLRERRMSLLVTFWLVLILVCRNWNVQPDQLKLHQLGSVIVDVAAVTSSSYMYRYSNRLLFLDIFFVKICTEYFSDCGSVPHSYPPFHFQSLNKTLLSPLQTLTHRTDTIKIACRLRLLLLHLFLFLWSVKLKLIVSRTF